TVAHAVVVLNLDLCASVLSHDGRRRTDEFVQQLAHELCHIALRRVGIHVAPWLEEGLCERLSGAPYDDDRLALAAIRLPEFLRFAGDPSTASRHGLMSFSAEPVDVNDGYLLAHDFVRWLERTADLDV